MSLTNKPTGAPFTVPPGATFSGGPVPTKDAQLYSALNSANELVSQYAAAMAAQGLTSSNLRIDDGIANGSYGQFTPGTAGESIFVVRATLTDADSVVYDLDDVAGQRIFRLYYPYQPGEEQQGDTNYIQVGHGANTVNEAVPGKMVIGLLASGEAQGHWEPA